jgi:hypothetical protein
MFKDTRVPLSKLSSASGRKLRFMSYVIQIGTRETGSGVVDPTNVIGEVFK